jgi:hypothetical protein
MQYSNAIFERTWGSRAGRRPSTEYWVDVISAIKSKHPGFLFIAEAYWDLEWELQQRGFDFCYDKKLYDRLEHSTAENTRLHLCADLAYQGKLLRFIENHDEPRAPATFSLAKQRASALTTATLPGIRLFHEGQFEGRKVRPPVFPGRRPDEPMDEDLRGFYGNLLAGVNRKAFREGQWSLCGRTGWPDNIGTVKDSLTGKPVDKILVIYAATDGTSSGNMGMYMGGEFRFNLPITSDFVIFVAAHGYKPWVYNDPADGLSLHLASGEQKSVEIELVPDPQATKVANGK